LIAAQPDFDKEWFESLNIEQVSKITEDEETKALETRRFKFACGCSLEKIIPTLSAWKDRPMNFSVMSPSSSSNAHGVQKNT
jgi:molecular chaperone Hsp33